MSKKNYGDLLAQEVSGRVGQPVADAPTLQTWTPLMCADGMTVKKLDDYTDWTYEAGSSSVAGLTCLVPTDGRATGRWIAREAINNTDHPPVANIAALQAITVSDEVDGMIVLKRDDMTRWMYNATSTATDASNSTVITPTGSVGRWLKIDSFANLLLPFTFATADAAVLYTVPVGQRLRILDLWWEINVNLTGGASSAIGVHASPAAFNTKGDLLGGAAGDIAATLVAASTREVGTVGTKMGSFQNQRCILIAADTLNFDQITSAFTAGSGNVRVLAAILANPGA